MQYDDADLDIDLDKVKRPIYRIIKVFGSGKIHLLLIGMFGGLIGTLAGFVAPSLLGVAIDSIFTGDQPFSLPLISDGLLPDEPRGQFIVVVGLIVSAYIIEGIFNLVRGLGLNLFAQTVKHNLRVETYRSIQSLPVNFFENHSTGELMSVMNSDVNNLQQFLSGGFTTLGRLVFTFLGVSAILFAINWQLAIVSLIVAPLIAIFTYFFVERIQPLYLEVRDQVGKINSLLDNNISGIKVIKANTMEDFEKKEVDKSSKKYFDINWKALKTKVTFFPGMRLLSGLAFVLTFVIGGFWVLSDQSPLFFTLELTVGEFVIFMLLTQKLIWPMANFGQFVNMYQEAMASAKRIIGLKNKSEQREDPGKELEGTEGRIEYENVSFGYEESEEILEDLSFEVESGESAAFVGPTGAGKSTVVKLLLKFYDIDGGEIRINDQSIADVSKSSLRSKVGYVSQENILFPESVEKNIAYAKPKATQEEIIEAAKSAMAHGFIQDLEDGYETQVGEDGVKLSGGQKQRIGIARAILQDPQILILDEATSDVDTETEVKIQKGLKHLTESRTVIAIAHRLSTIKNSDKIIVMEEGKIVEQGTHRDLLKQDGVYAKLWKVQAGEIEEASEYFIDK